MLLVADELLPPLEGLGRGRAPGNEGRRRHKEKSVNRSESHLCPLHTRSEQPSPMRLLAVKKRPVGTA